MIRVLHQLAFGDLQLDQRVLHARRGDDGLDPRVEVRQPELARRQVDRHRARAQAGGPPGLEVLASAAQHPFAHGHDEAGLLEHGDELHRQDDAALGVLPAQQRLGAAHAALRQVELGLVDQREFLALQRTPEFHAHLGASTRALVDLRGEELVGVASRLLRPVHRRVGSPEQRLGVAAVAREDGDADTGGDERLLAVDFHRLREALDNLLRHQRRVFRPRQVA